MWPPAIKCDPVVVLEYIHACHSEYLFLPTIAAMSMTSVISLHIYIIVRRVSLSVAYLDSNVTPVMLAVSVTL